MKEIIEVTKPLGGIIAIVEYKTRQKEIYCFPNTILDNGRHFLMNALLNHDEKKAIYIQNMLFGDAGIDQEGKKKTVAADRNALFGIVRANKRVVGQIDPEAKNQAIFTAVLSFEEANGHSLNEMALQLNNEDLFSMATFPSLGKTDQMKISWHWKISFI